MTMTPLREISNFLDRVSRDNKDLAVQAHKKISVDVFSGVIFLTPVKTGRARGGWQMSIGSPSEVEGDLDTNGNQTLFAGISALGPLQPFGVVWISNNVSYIGDLENGTSQQAPSGMVEITLQRVAESLR